ncbi:hypothetical protein IF2G_02293 [Cordyceps javanica]|nr:hypothetical protein IF2G_02293 [Cordyceps javanica]
MPEPKGSRGLAISSSFWKNGKNGALVLEKLKDASSRIIAQLNKHTVKLAQLGDVYGKVRLAVTLRGLDGATEQGIANFAGEFGNIMHKAGQLEPLIRPVDSPGIISAASSLESGTMAVIERQGGLSKYVVSGSKILEPLGVAIGA